MAIAPEPEAALPIPNDGVGVCVAQTTVSPGVAVLNRAPLQLFVKEVQAALDLTDWDIVQNSPIDSDSIIAFNSKYNLDISPYLAKYYTEPTLESSSNKRKDNPTTKPTTVDPYAPGLAAVWSIAHPIANFHIVLPPVDKLQGTIEKSNSPEPVLTQALENLVCTLRSQVRTSESSITTVHNSVNDYSADADIIIQAKAINPLEAPFVDPDPTIAIPALDALLLLCGLAQTVPSTPMAIAPEPEAALLIPDDGVGVSVAQSTEGPGVAVVNRASLQLFGREVQAALDLTDWDILQCTKVLEVSGIADWYHTVQTNTLESLRSKRVSLALPKTELEQEYRLLTASDDSVIARPSP